MSSKGDTQGKKHTEEKNSIFPYVKRKKNLNFFFTKVLLIYQSGFFVGKTLAISDKKEIRKKYKRTQSKQT